MVEDEPFADLIRIAACCMATSNDLGGGVCVCSPKERIVRAYMVGNGPRPFTAAERANLVADADHAGEGYYSKAELEAMDDKDLAAATLNAWSMYVQSQL